MKKTELSTDFTSWPKEKQLLSKFIALQLLGFEQKATRKHFLTLSFLLDWYHDGYGNALASFQFIRDRLIERDPGGKGLYVGAIHDAVQDLVAWEFVHAEVAPGRKASRYFPNWTKFCIRDSQNENDESIRETPNENSIRESPNESVRESQNETPACVREFMNEDPLTRPGEDPETSKVGVKSSPAQGHGLAAGQHVEDCFEEAFRAYGAHGNRDASLAVWEELSPDEDLTAHIISQAASWKRTAKPRTRRMPFERWLSEGRYAARKKGVVKSPRRSGCTTRDITILEITEAIGRPVLVCQMNDAQAGEAETVRLQLDQADLEELEFVTDYEPVGSRLWLFVNDETREFEPHPENEMDE